MRVVTFLLYRSAKAISRIKKMGKEKETFEEYIRGIIKKKVFSD
jgi:hypothetical protein